MATAKTVDGGLTQQQELFCVAFIRHGGKSKAFREAYPDAASRMLPKSVARRALDVWNVPKVQQRIQQLREQLAAVVERQVEQAMGDQLDTLKPAAKLIYDKVKVFSHWQDIVMADPLKVITHRRICCRHCHGKDNHYQWRDKKEFTDALAKILDANNLKAAQRRQARGEANKLAVGADEELPTDAGGYGFRFNEKPAPTCPKCLGEGHSDIFIHDFDQLGERERKLVKTIKMKRDGTIEVVMHDQQHSLELMAKTLGMLAEVFKIKGPDEADDVLPALPLDQTEASRKYAEFFKGG